MDSELSKLVDEWISLDPNPDSQAEIRDLVQRNDFDELDRRMRPRIQFGTAGLRAEMRPGFSGMNDVTVLQASQGLASYVAQNVTDAKTRGVVIGYDHRHNSHRFAELTAAAFDRKGFKVYLYSQLVHTPLVPFGITHLNAACGVMITASHNPAKDNGYKVYWENGCQIIPPHDIGIADEIERNLVPWSWDVSNVTPDQQTLLKITVEYFKSVKDNLVENCVSSHSSVKTEATLVSKSSDASPRFVYTAMHGVGNSAFMKVASILGLSDQIVSVEEQQFPNPDFPTVKFPNPEEKGALDLAKAKADEHGCLVVLANDPDADRFAAAVKNEETGEWVQLTGNQLGALFAYHEFQRYQNKKKEGASKDGKEDIKPLALLNSTVSSQLIRSMAEKEGFKYEDTLTGFKWIGNRAMELVKEGYEVPFAFEEAIGYMFPVVFDKDGISAATVFLQMIVNWHTQGTNALKVLNDQIFAKYGYFAEHNSYYTAEDPKIIAKVFDKVRYGDKTGESRVFNKEPDTIGKKYQVLAWRDLTIGYDSTTASKKPTLPVSSSSQMITVELEPVEPSNANERLRFTARGSGTEPKLKVYIEATASNEKRAQFLADDLWDVLAVEWFKDLA